MLLTIELPENLGSHADPAHEALEAFAVEAVRTHVLTRTQAASVLHMGRIEFQDLLLREGVVEGFYGVEEFLQDVETGDALRAEGLIPG